jgi:hypothetical protein
MQVLRSQEDGVRVCAFPDHRVALGRHALEADLRHLIEHQHLGLSGNCRGNPAGA